MIYYRFHEYHSEIKIMNRYSSGNTYDLDETGRQGIIMNKYGTTALYA